MSGPFEETLSEVTQARVVVYNDDQTSPGRVPTDQFGIEVSV
jgi:hypothetical protein